MKLLPYIQSLGFTRNEIKVVTLLSITFLVGLGLRSVEIPFLYSPPPPAVYDYAATDSIFNARSRKPARASSDSTVSSRTEARRRSESSSSSPVNINAARKSELMKLPGIGAVYADRIIAYRTERGPFKAVEDLLHIKGIGKKKLERLRPHITLK
jgi:comEA protein